MATDNFLNIGESLSEVFSGQESSSSRIKRDFRSFLESCVRNEKNGDLVVIQEFQEKVIEILLAKSKLKLIILPRGFAKSTLVTIGFSGWRIGNDPNIRIMVVSHTEDQAASHLRGIEGVFKEEKYKSVFGDMIPENPKVTRTTWTGSDKVVAKRSRNLRQPTLKALGSGSQKSIGTRCDLLVIDDIISQEHASSPAMRDAAWNYFNSALRYTLQDENSSEIIIVNTRYHSDDVAGRLKKLYEEEEDPNEFMVLDIPALLRDAEGEEYSIWEDRFPTEALKADRVRNYFEFQSNRMNDPIDMTNLRLGDYLDYFPEHEFYKIQDDCEYFFGIDPNTDRETMDKDAFAVIVVGVHKHTKRVYIVDLLWTIEDLGVVRDKFRALAYKWKPKAMILEENGAQGLYATLFNENQEYLNYPFVKKTETEKKEDRIIRMASHFMAGRVHILGFADPNGRMHPTARLDQFRLEWVAFPESKEYHYDALDACEKVLSHIIYNAEGPVLTTIDPKVFNSRMELEQELRKTRATRDQIKEGMNNVLSIGAHYVAGRDPDVEVHEGGRICIDCPTPLEPDRQFDRCVECNVKILERNEMRKSPGWRRRTKLGTISGGRLYETSTKQARAMYGPTA